MQHTKLNFSRWSHLLLFAACLVGTACSSNDGAEEESGKSSVPAPQVNVSGSWDTQWSSQATSMSLTQSGSEVTGSYEFAIGTIDPYYEFGSLEGTVSERRLTGSVSDKYGTTSIKFDFSSDAQSFAGTYGSSGTWNGTRAN